jgi:hypothetical protein
VRNETIVEDGKAWKILAPGLKDPRYISPHALCLAPGDGAAFSLVADLRELFPSGNMFNVRWLDNEPQLVDRGIGNWLKLALPLEHGNGREALEVTFTAKDSRVWLQYH